MFQAKGNSFMSKNLRKYIMARLIKKGLYMKKWIKSFEKVNWSKDKKKKYLQTKETILVSSCFAKIIKLFLMKRW